MRLEIMEKAIYYFYSGMVTKVDETKNYIYYEVDGERVDFKKGGGYLEINCTCTHCSVLPVKKIKENEKTIIYITQLLCSRKIACLLESARIHRQKQLKREKKQK